MNCESEIVENFFGVYLLKCSNPKYKGRTYIGYTVDPNRRIKQHNKGKLFGGAWKTSNRGPWDMMLIVHGFPSDISALRFEWAWQHPKKSRRLKNQLPVKKSRESSYDYCLKLMWTMLRTPPWCRLPLTVRWLHDDFTDAPLNLSPPVHMPIVHGPVKSKKLTTSPAKSKEVPVAGLAEDVCGVCSSTVLPSEQMKCFNTTCTNNTFHILCLSRVFLDCNDDQYVPVDGECPSCGLTVLWGDLVRYKNGCYQDNALTSEDAI